MRRRCGRRDARAPGRRRARACWRALHTRRRKSFLQAGGGDDRRSRRRPPAAPGRAGGHAGADRPQSGRAYIRHWSFVIGRSSHSIAAQRLRSLAMDQIWWRKIVREIVAQRSRTALTVLSIAVGLFAVSLTFRTQAILSRNVL